MNLAKKHRAKGKKHLYLEAGKEREKRTPVTRTGEGPQLEGAQKKRFTRT